MNVSLGAREVINSALVLSIMFWIIFQDETLYQQQSKEVLMLSISLCCLVGLFDFDREYYLSSWLNGVPLMCLMCIYSFNLTSKLSKFNTSIISILSICVYLIISLCRKDCRHDYSHSSLMFISKFVLFLELSLVIFIHFTSANVSNFNFEIVVIWTFLFFQCVVWMEDDKNKEALRLSLFEGTMVRAILGIAIYSCLNYWYTNMNADETINEIEAIMTDFSVIETSFYLTQMGILTVVALGELFVFMSERHYSGNRNDSILLVYFTTLVTISSILVYQCRINVFIFIYKLIFEDDYNSSTNTIRGIWVFCIWGILLLLLVPLSSFLSERFQLRKIVARKLFHFIAVILFAPAIHVARDLTALSFGVATCILVFIEYSRHLAPNNGVIQVINRFYNRFIDSRDSDRRVVLTHIQLLLGCAIPVWVSQAQIGFTDGNGDEKDNNKYILLPHLGWITVGIADAASAIVGSLYGNVKWIGSSRTLEGSLAGLISALLACKTVLVVVSRSTEVDTNGEWWAVVVAMGVASIIEAFTFDEDNILLPLVAVVLYMTVR